MERTPLRQSEYETSITASASRMPIIDAAVATLQGQMEDLIERIDRYHRLLNDLTADVMKLKVINIDALEELDELAKETTDGT